MSFLLYTTHDSVSLFCGFLDSCRYIWPTVHTIEDGGEIYAWNIIVSGGSGAASSNLAATNSNLSANISLLLTSVRWIVIGDIPSSKSPPYFTDCLL